MFTFRTLSVATVGLSLFAGTGCMRGMSYRIPMPASLTIGTIQEEPPTQIDPKIRRGQRSPVVTAVPREGVEARFVATAQ